MRSSYIMSPPFNFKVVRALWLTIAVLIWPSYSHGQPECASAHADVLCPGDITSSVDVRSGNIFEFTTERARIRLEVLSDETVRVRVLPGSALEFDTIRSAAVTRTQWPPPTARHGPLDGISFVITTSTLRIEIERKPFRLIYKTKAGQLIAEEAAGGGLRWIPDRDPNSLEDGVDTGKKQIHFKIHDGEDFYGLGHKVRAANDVSLSWKNRVRAFPDDSFGNVMENVTDETTLKKSANANIDVPILYSTQGYAIFFDNSYKKFWDFRGPTSWFGEALGGELRYYFLYGPGLKKLLMAYANLTGRAALLPLYAFGVGQGGYEPEDPEWKLDSWRKVREMVARYRTAGIPLDSIFLDLYWFGGLGNGTVCNRLPGDDGESQMGSLSFDEHDHYCCDFANAATELRQLREQGIRVIVIEEPFVAKTERMKHFERLTTVSSMNPDTPLTPRINGQPVLLGTSARNPCLWWGEGTLIDSTNPAAMQFWWDKVQSILQRGVAGIWLDLGEPEVDPADQPVMAQTRAHGLSGWETGGESWYAINNLWNLEAIKGLFQPWANQGGSRPFFLTRSGFAGQQRYGAAIWSGDVQSKDSWLTAQNSAGLNAGLSGMPYWNTDVGGFRDRDSRDPERLLVRWSQNAVFHPIMRFHGHYNNSPFLDSQGHVRLDVGAAVKLRYRLLPYIYAAARDAYDTGLPIMRPVVLEYPDDRNVRDLGDEYFFGPSILVAPVTSETADARNVYLPSGQWFHWFTLQSFDGPSNVTVQVPLDQVPAFVKAGAIIPMSTEISNTNELQRAKVALRIFPGGDGSVRLYEDDGRTLQYQAGKFRETEITSRIGTKRWDITVKPTTGHYDGESERRDIEIDAFLPSDKTVTQVNHNGRAIQQGAAGIGWSVQGRGVVVRLSDLNVRKTQKIKLILSSLP